MPKILIADDDPTIRELLKQFLEVEGFTIEEAATGSQVMAAIDGGSAPDLILIDLRMPELTGMEVLQKLNEQGISVPVILITAYGSSSETIKAMQLGAYDYITKPFQLDDVLVTIKRALDYSALSEEVRQLRDQVPAVDPSERVVGHSPKMLEVYKTIGRVARTDATVLIMGETGTGKELVAETVHQNSLRRNGPLVKVACASLPETLLESELFGHEKGSFTGAIVQRKGRFELANKGTIFLDEIGEMSLGTQKKLLRVLQEREFERVGGNVPLKIDTRVVAATNKDLQAEVGAGRFREDLYYRLNVIAIRMPPLRDRKDDIPALVDHFLNKHRLRPTTPPAKISEAAINVLLRHDWPGNVRELENTIERSIVLAHGGIITPEHLLLTPSPQRRFIDLEDRVRQKVQLGQILEDIERAVIQEALRQSNGDAAAAARLIQLDEAALTSRLDTLDPHYTP